MMRKRHESVVENMNLRTYENENVVACYREAGSLFGSEMVILTELKEELPTARLLDIGIGTGRTTQHLVDKCLSYTGIDYSPAMLRIARERFPSTDFRQMAASDLSAFEDEHFDIVLFSYNGIDSATQESRQKIIGEVHRVLRPGGAFAFSTHNRGTTIEAAYDLQNLERARRPRDVIPNVIRYLSGIMNAARMKKHERHETEYALLNDNAHEYRLLHYYITPQAQVAQLERHGFRNLFCMTIGGHRLDPGAAQSTEPWLYYLARKCERRGH